MLEIACFHPSSALLASKYGASRIEFCAGASVGGVTPEKSDVEAVKKEVQIPINVMIRPRGGNFVYSESEIELMREDIERFRDVADGFVFGILTEAGHVDEKNCIELLKLAGGKPCTFHRAFDECGEPFEAAEAIHKCGFNAILTSGCEPTAVDGVDTVRQLQERYFKKLEFILAGGVRSKNIELLQNQAGPTVEWFHSAAILDGGEIADEAEIRRLGKFVT